MCYPKIVKHHITITGTTVKIIKRACTNMVLVQVVIGDKLVGQQKPEKIKNIRLVFPVHSTSPSYNRGAV